MAGTTSGCSRWVRRRLPKISTHAREVLQQTSGAAVTGYRAPSFSIDARTPWAHEVLARHGYTYSSSVAPIVHDHYGWREAPRFAFRPVAGSSLIEVPVTTAEVAGRRMAAGGGGFFRLLPYAVSRWAVERVNVRDGRPAVFYFHPWEDRSQSAAPRRCAAAFALSALYQSGRDGRQAAAPAGCVQLGPDGRRRRCRSRPARCRKHGSMNAPFRPARVAVRLADPGDRAAIARFVAEAEGATPFHRLRMARRCHPREPATGRTYWWPNAAAILPRFCRFMRRTRRCSGGHWSRAGFCSWRRYSG